jgi:hypothetical protein
VGRHERNVRDPRFSTVMRVAHALRIRPPICSTAFATQVALGWPR